MSGFTPVVLTHESGQKGEFRVNADESIEVLYADDSAVANQNAEFLFASVNASTPWNGGNVRMRFEGAVAIVIIQIESGIKFLKGNKEELIQAIQQVFDSNPESSGGFKRLDARKLGEQEDSPE